MLFYVTIAVLLAGAQAKFYRDCGSKVATVQSVSISDCAPTLKECRLKSNTNVSINIDFTPSQDVSTIDTDVHGVVMNIPVPFPLPQPDACQDSGLSCPLKSGTKVSYSASFPVLESYPKIGVGVKWELKTESKEELICLLISARIV